MKELILGGVRSGKSRLAENRASESGLSVIYVATAMSHGDDEPFNQRIESHRDRRPDHWITVEEPIKLSSVLQRYDDPKNCILIDCMTLWVTNLLCAENSKQSEAEIQSLLKVLPELNAQVILVSNESGLGITPMGQLSRDFLDTIGELHQQLADVCDRVTLTVAGLPLTLKGGGMPMQDINQ